MIREYKYSWHAEFPPLSDAGPATQVTEWSRGDDVMISISGADSLRIMVLSDNPEGRDVLDALERKYDDDVD